MLINGDSKRGNVYCVIKDLGEDTATTMCNGFNNCKWEINYSNLSYSIKQDLNNFYNYARKHGYKVIKNLDTDEEWIVSSDYKTINKFKTVSIILPGTFSKKRKFNEQPIIAHSVVANELPIHHDVPAEQEVSADHSISKILKYFKLEKYIDIFEENGYDDIKFLLKIKKENNEKFENICINKLNMLSGHFEKLNFYLEEFSEKFIK